MEEMAPGYRFYPTEDELISFYLHNRLKGKRDDISRIIPLLDVYQHEPSQLPNHCGELCHGDTEQWFFFVPRKEREVRGGRPSRTTASGYWKATGSPSYVYSGKNKVIGVKKSMVYYKGKAPNGRKTPWKMNEYRAIEQDLPTSTPKLRHELSLCRVYVVSGTVRAFDRRPVSETTSSGKVKIIHENGRCGSGCSMTEEKATTSYSPELRFSEGNQSGDDEYNMENVWGEGSLIDNLEALNGLENLMDWDNIGH